MKHFLRRVLAAVLLGLLLSLSACTGEVTPTPSPAPTDEPSARPTATPEPENKLEELSDGMVIGEVSEARMEFQGVSRRYMYYIPSTFDGKRMPIMLALHGSGGNAEIQMEAGNYAEIAEREGFIVVVPNAVVVLPYLDKRATYKNFSAEGLTLFDVADVYGDMALHYVRHTACSTDPAAQAGIDDPAFYQELLGFYYDNGFADKNRTFVSGHSHGGFMALRLAYEYPEQYAGVASVCGLALGELRDLPGPDRQIKLVFVHSANDPTVPPEGMIYSPATVPPDGVWALSLDDSIALFMEKYGLGELTETDRVRLDPLTEYDTARVTRIEYNDGAAIKYWYTGKNYETGGAGHAWPGSPSDPANFSQHQATDLFWPDLKVELLEEIPSAALADGKLTISVTRVYDNGVQDTVSEVFAVTEDVAETFKVDDCLVYVVTEGTAIGEVRLEK